jgi:hypothetical protein
MRIVPGPLDDWTTAQLLAEVLKRNALDPASLRTMHELTLRALLTALDRPQLALTAA